MNMLAAGVAWLRQQVNDHAGVDITYHVGNTSTGAFSATVSKSDFESVGESGVIIKRETRDYIFDPAKLNISGEFKPQEGHIIQQVAGSKCLTCKVLDFGEGPFRQDPDRQMIRVFTDVVNEVSI